MQCSMSIPRLNTESAPFFVCINSLGEIGQISGKILYKLIPSLSDPNGSCESPKKFELIRGEENAQIGHALLPVFSGWAQNDKYP